MGYHKGHGNGIEAKKLKIGILKGILHKKLSKLTCRVILSTSIRPPIENHLKGHNRGTEAKIEDW